MVVRSQKKTNNTVLIWKGVEIKMDLAMTHQLQCLILS